MSVENIGTNKYKFTFSVDAAKFEEGMAYSYNKNKGYFNIQGFRKGKAPRKIVEMTYGKEVLYDDAYNFVLNEVYPSAADETGLKIVSKPEIDIVSNDENGVVFSAEVYVKPEVTVGEYKGLKCTKVNTDVTDDEVEAQIEAVLQKHSRMIDVTDRAIESGDIAVIDFEGFIDGVAFDGGKGSDFNLEIGSHTFIDTFEDQLIGKNIADDVDVNVTFPEDYQQADLAGKPALFKVEIKSIKKRELPELTDEFVQDIATEYETVDDFRKDTKAKLILKKSDEAKSAKQEELIEKLIGIAEMEVPQAMVENEIDLKINDFANNIRRQGLSLDMYLQYMGQSMETMREAYRIISEKHVKGRLALEAVAQKENLEVTEDEVKAELERIAKNYGLDNEKIDSIFGEKEKESIVDDLKVQKALDLIVENAVEEEAAE